MNAIQGSPFPANVEYQVELNFLVAIEQSPHFNTKKMYFDPYLRPDRFPIKVKDPDVDFDYEPLQFSFLDRNKIRYGAEEAGWALRTIASALDVGGLETNWTGQGCLLPKPTNDSLEEVWTISMNPHLAEDQEDEFQWLGVSILSPVFRNDITKPILATKLKKTLKILDEEFLIITNSDCRLRVKVRPIAASLALDELKKVASLLWAIDPLLNTIHPPHCGPGSLKALGWQYTKLAEYKDHIDIPLSLASADFVEDPWSDRLTLRRRPLPLLEHPGSLSELRFRHGLDRIQNTATFEELVNLLDTIPVQPGTESPASAAYNAAYDFRGMSQRGDNAMLRFNQHCGTLDFTAIISWVAVCANIVSISLDKSSEEVLTLVQPLLRSPQHDDAQDNTQLVDLLREFGLKKMAEYYADRFSGARIPDLANWPLLKPTIPHDDSKPSAHTMISKIRFQEEVAVYQNLPKDSELKRNEKYDSQVDEFGARLARWDGLRSSDNGSRYTMGIEIEMLMAYCHTEESVTPDCESGGERLVGLGGTYEREKQLADILTKLGVPARQCIDGIYDFNAKKFFRDQGLVVQEQYMDYEQAIDWQYWGCKEDTSVSRIEPWKGYGGIAGIEIASPIYRNTPECWEAILDVVSGLRREMRLSVDESCGFHVSVGTGTELIPFEVVTKVNCLVFLADHVIFSLCHPNRRAHCAWSSSIRDYGGIESEFKKDWDLLPATHDFLQHFPVDDIPSKLAIQLKRYWMARDIGELLNLNMRLGENGKPCVSLARINPNKGPTGTGKPIAYTGSVEFRYLEGTLDPELILRYSQLMVALFRFAETAEPKAWRSITRDLAKTESAWTYDLSILQSFLEHLGVEDDLDYWEQRAQMNWELDVKKLTDFQYTRQHIDKEFMCFTNYMESLSIWPEVPLDQVEYLRKEVCQRQGKFNPTGQYLTPIEPETVVVDARTDLVTRTKPFLKSLSLDGSDFEKRLDQVVSQADCAEVRLRGTEEFTKQYLKERHATLESVHDAEDVEAPSKSLTPDQIKAAYHDAYEADGTAGLLTAIERNAEKGKPLETKPPSRKEWQDFLGLEDEEFVDDGDSFLFDSFTKIEGPILETDLTTEDWERFLQG
ncbi:hypothetical protein G7046_g29 [Stylonectria norvegica]|nr:hypothetical protein G7046_g29 [Stylonectria norvegica]